MQIALEQCKSNCNLSMKNSICILLLAMVFAGCSQKEIKEARETMRSADSLISSTKETVKSVDSLTKIVKDTAALNRVVVPEIEKAKRSVEKVITSNAKSLDSISAVIKSSTKTIQKGREILVDMDSARAVLENSSSPLDALATISKTLDKISTSIQNEPQTSDSKQPTQEPESKASNGSASEQQEPSMAPAPVPLMRSGKVEIETEDFSAASKLTQELINSYGGEIQYESFGRAEDRNSREIRAEVPSQYFDRFLEELSSVGLITSKELESRGSGSGPNATMAQVEIRLIDMGPVAAQSPLESDSTATVESSTYKDKSASAFMKGLDLFKSALLFVLPAWPFLLIAALVWYLVYRFRRRKQVPQSAVFEEEPTAPGYNSGDSDYKRPNEMENKENTTNESHLETKSPSYESSNSSPESSNETEDPWAKYKPKQ